MQSLQKNYILSLSLKTTILINSVFIFTYWLLLLSQFYSIWTFNLTQFSQSKESLIYNQNQIIATIYNLETLAYSTFFIGGLFSVQFLFWLYRAYKNVNLVGIKDKPLQAVLSLLLPFVNLILMNTILQNLWKASSFDQSLKDLDNWKNELPSEKVNQISLLFIWITLLLPATKFFEVYNFFYFPESSLLNIVRENLFSDSFEFIWNIFCYSIPFYLLIHLNSLLFWYIQSIDSKHSERLENREQLKEF